MEILNALLRLKIEVGLVFYLIFVSLKNDLFFLSTKSKLSYEISLKE